MNAVSQPKHARILPALVRPWAPELVFSARFVRPHQRTGLLATALVVQLLDNVVAGQSADPTADAEPDEPTGPSTCACGAASLEGRCAVAHNIVNYLDEQARSGSEISTGRPEMDVFVRVIDEHDLPAALIHEIVDALARARHWSRVPTMRILDDVALGCARPMLRLFEHFTQVPGADNASADSLALGLALAQRIWAMRIEAARDRLAIPLDRLAAHAARDRDLLAALVENKTPDHPGINAALRETLRHAQSHLRAGHDYLQSLPSPAMRGLAMFAGTHAQAINRLITSDQAPVQLLRDLTDRQKINRFLSRGRFRTWRLALAGRLDAQPSAKPGAESMERAQ